MQVRYPGVIMVSVAMALHAAAVGRYLESVFFIVAFCWAWVAVTASRGKLQAAQSMALTMTVMLSLIVLPLAVLRLDTVSLVAHLQLAVVPGIISWACMLIYIRHLSRQDLTAGAGIFDGIDFTGASAVSAPVETAAFPDDAIVSMQPANGNGAAPDASLSRIRGLLASLRPAAASRDAA